MKSLFETINNDPALTTGQRSTLLALIAAGEIERAKKLYEEWKGKRTK